MVFEIWWSKPTVKNLFLASFHYHRHWCKLCTLTMLICEGNMQTANVHVHIIASYEPRWSHSENYTMKLLDECRWKLEVVQSNAVFVSGLNTWCSRFFIYYDTVNIWFRNEVTSHNVVILCSLIVFLQYSTCVSYQPSRLLCHLCPKHLLFLYFWTVMRCCFYISVQP